MTNVAVRRLGRTSGAAALVASAILLGFVFFVTFIAPRPYYVTDIDSEQDYYYNAHLAANHLSVTVHHPGTPVQQLGRLILAVVGDGLERTQRFFDVAYLVAALASVIAIAVFVKLVMSDEPFGVSLLALACVIAWPPFLTYLNNFGSDSFIVAVGLPTLALFWVSLAQPIDRGRRVLAFCGVGLGICLAVKVTFVPVAAALFAAALVRGWVRSRPGQPLTRRARAALVGILPLVGGAVLGFLGATIPIWGRLTLVWQRTFDRKEAFPQGGGFLVDSAKTLSVLMGANPLLVAVMGGTALFFGALVLRESLTAGARRASRVRGAGDEFDFVASGVCVVILALGFIYTAAASVAVMPDSEPGIRLRNISPTALFIPFALAYCARWVRTRTAPGARQGWWVQAGLGAIAIAVAGLGISRHLSARQVFIEDRTQRIEVTLARLDQLVDGLRRVAFWTGSDQDYLGPASFHFWGNYRYANHHFDRKVLEQFPDYAFLRLRHIERQNTPPTPSLARSRYGRLGDLYWSFKRWLLHDRVYYRDVGGILTGQEEGIGISAFAFPARELRELPSMSLIDLEALVRDRYGKPRVWTERVDDVDWVFLKLRGSDDTLSRAGR